MWDFKQAFGLSKMPVHHHTVQVLDDPMVKSTNQALTPALFFESQLSE